MKPIALVALGGHALLKKGEKGTVSEQEKNAAEVASYLIPLIEKGYELIITHGNGPQVGNILLKNEMASHILPPMPLDVCVADSQGSMGYFLQQALLNELRKKQIKKFVVTMITQVIVDKDDPAFKKPTKPIGQYFTKEEADILHKERGWVMGEQKPSGFRRLVPSPRPLKVVQRHMVRDLVHASHVVIAAGGGGIPIWKKPDGDYEGIEAVVDKDLASSVLAQHMRADIFIILTAVSHVSLYFNTPEHKDLHKVTRQELAHHLSEGHFPEGSMGPKVNAALAYLAEVDKKVIITSSDKLLDALDGKDGTIITR